MHKPALLCLSLLCGAARAQPYAYDPDTGACLDADGHPGHNLGVVGPCADLRGADLKGAPLAGADLRGALLDEAKLFRADLSGANLTGASLEGAHLIQVDLRAANLTGARLGRAHLGRARLAGAKLARADLRTARLELAPEVRQAQLAGAYADETTTWPEGGLAEQATALVWLDAPAQPATEALAQAPQAGR